MVRLGLRSKGSKVPYSLCWPRFHPWSDVTKKYVRSVAPISSTACIHPTPKELVVSTFKPHNECGAVCNPGHISELNAVGLEMGLVGLVGLEMGALPPGAEG